MEENSELERILSMVQQHDTYKRIQASDELKKYLNDPLNPLTAESIDFLVDNLKGWISSSNYKVVDVWFIFVFIKQKYIKDVDFLSPQKLKIEEKD